jgi:hypothetical protein
MGSIISMLVGAALALGIVLLFWQVFVTADDLLHRSRRH